MRIEKPEMIASPETAMKEVNQGSQKTSIYASLYSIIMNANAVPYAAEAKI